MDHPSSPRPVYDSVPIALSRAREAVMAHFRPLLSDRGFTEQQWRVLRVLYEHGPMEPTGLAHEAALLLPSLTRILKDLEHRDAISRVTDQEDRHRVRIAISATAAAAIAAAAESTEQAYAEIEAAFGKQNMTQLLSLLNQLSDIHPERQNNQGSAPRTR